MPVTDDLIFASARELAALYRARKTSPVEVAQAVLAAIDRWNPHINAYCFVDPEITLTDAARSEARWLKGESLGPADGIPFGVKDILLARGCPTGYGSVAARKAEASLDDAPSVARLREAGAVFMGKTTTSEFGWKGTADSPLTGIVRNVWNTQVTSGGSSGGAACAAAAGLGNFQLGTDGGGSVRIPASFCGVAGMKATFGRVPAWPPGPMLTLSNVGPITRTIDDLECMLRIITQPDERDWHAVPRALGERPNAAQSLKGMRLGVHLGGGMCEPEIEQIVQRVADHLAEVGVLIEETQLPLSGAKDLIRTHWEAGASWLVSQIPEERRELLDAGLRAAARRGAAVSLPDYYRAMIDRQKFGEAMQRHLGQFDAVLSPTVPILPFAAGREAPASAASQDWLDWNPLTYPFNLSRQPAISIPAGFARNGLPIGVQLAGKLYDDAWLVCVARLIEEAFDVGVSRPRVPSPRTTSTQGVMG